MATELALKRAANAQARKERALEPDFLITTWVTKYDLPFTFPGFVVHRRDLADVDRPYRDAIRARWRAIGMTDRLRAWTAWRDAFCRDETPIDRLVTLASGLEAVGVVFA